MAFSVGRVVIYSILWFGCVGLANGIDQIREHPYWFHSGGDSLLYLLFLFFVYGIVGILFGLPCGLLAGRLLRHRGDFLRGSEPVVALLAAILVLGAFRIQSDFAADALSPARVLVNLALLSGAGIVLLALVRFRLPWAAVSRALLASTALIVLTGLAAGTLLSAHWKEVAENRPNILLIVIDTLRADRLSCYGNPRPTSPAIDRIAREGAVFTDPIATAPLTQPAVSTLLTGLYPRAAGVINHPSRLPDSHSTLAETLGDAGYRTAFVCSHPLLTPSCGFGQGWDEYRYIPKPSRFEATLLAQAMRRLGLVEFRPGEEADEITDAAIELATKGSSRPFFLYVHYVDPHFPYTPPPPYDVLFAAGPRPRHYDERLPDGRRRIFNVEISRDAIREMVELYDGEIAFTDREIGRLLAALEARGVLDDTFVVLTGDHGESLGEQGLFFAHTHYLYDSTQRVPLIFRFPRRLPGGLVIEEPVGLVDLAPTLHQIAGVAPPAEMEGTGLLPLLRGGGRERRPVFAENGRTVLDSGEEENPRWTVDGDQGRWSMVRLGDWKLVRVPTLAGPIHELYDLEGDPGEAVNLAEARPDMVAALGASLHEFLGHHPAPAAEGIPLVDEETVEGLRSLGYVR